MFTQFLIHFVSYLVLFISVKYTYVYWKVYVNYLYTNVVYISCRTPMTLPISKRDSLSEKDIMFRDLGALTCQSSQDNGLDGPYPSSTNKLEQVKNNI